jgi:putative phosphoesterase
MKIVILSDIHANFPALQALSEDWDELWMIGDLVNYGPNPNEVIDWVRSHAHCVVRGNHDHAIGFSVDPRCSPPYRAMASETGAFTASVISEDSKRYLERLPLSSFRRLREHTFYLCHATPSDPLFGYLDKDSPQWESEVKSTESRVVVTGHTHVPFLRHVGDQILINPGSIGQPKTGAPEACYAVWEDGELELRRYAYPVPETESQIRRMPISESVKADLIQALRTGGASAQQTADGLPRTR